MNTTHKLKDTDYLDRCIYLAQRASSDVYPNPRVGAVIVHQDRIIGEGYHAQAGGPHAEVVAIKSVREKALLSESTLYVSLEPCNHHGKTPPCSEAIIQHQIPRVVVGTEDPNPKVAGGGINRLREAGIAVVLANEQVPFQLLNQVFWINQLENRPYIVLKWAVSRNGYIAGMDEQGRPFPVAITGRVAKEQVHALRAYHHGIMVGKNTVEADDPKLTTRLYPGKDPIRIIFDRKLSLPQDLKVFADGGDTIILNEYKTGHEGPLQYYQLSQWNNMKELVQELYQQLGICSILIEGGTLVLQQFIDQHMYDELYMYQGSTSIRYGVPAPVLSTHFYFDQVQHVGKDVLYYKRK